MSVLPAPARGPAALDSRTLPFSWYSDPGIYRQEQAEIFAKSWLYAGPAHAVAKAGDFFRIDIGNVPVLVTRDRDGGLHAMVNVCRHRGAEVKLERSGNCLSALTCHYHAWTYTLDGSLAFAPRARQEAGFDKA
jgi:phenylpropionate dioxygenase-like ring-hydroxylating dioxygenase large terminal subunit